MTSLFKTYFKLAIRHSWKNKWPVSINIVGLGLALSLCVFLYMVFAYNIEFDSYYKNTDDIYRVHAFTSDNGQEYRNEASPLPLDNKLRNEISGINQVAGYRTTSVTIKKDADYFSESAGVASADFPDMFEMPLKYGSWADFKKGSMIYLTESQAIKYFGKEFALGKELTVYFSNNEKIIMTVGGVLEKIPLNSSFDFGLLISLGDFLKGLALDPNDWSNQRYLGHYLRLSDGQKDRITTNLNQYIELQNENHETFKFLRFELIPFISPLVADDVLSADYVNARLRPAVFIIFAVLISMVFFTACFNLANTSMALIARRLKEIGIRKTLGSNNKQILIQFLFEMGIICVLAFVIALSTANLTASAILGLFSVKFVLQDFNLTNVVIFIACFLVITTLVAGLLPGLYAWRFQPVEIMRKSIKLRGVSWMNKTLVIVQYGFSIAVLIAGVTFTKNSDFLDEINLGYQEKRIFDIPIDTENYTVLKQEIQQIPGITVAGTKNHLGNNGRYSDLVTMQVNAKDHSVNYYGLGEKYLDLMEVIITSGRGFIAGSKADEQSILVNQQFVEQYFLSEDPINQVVKINNERKTIVGITTDILDDVYEDVELVPVVFGLAKEENFQHILVKVSHGELDNVEDQLKTIWNKHIDKPFTGKLQKDIALGSAARDTKNLQAIFLAVALLSGFLSIAGIFSLAKLNIAKRLREITIRKVLGANLRDIMLAINKSFSTILLLGLVVGCALGYLVSNSVLGMIYKYHVQVSLLNSILSSALIITISILMLSGVAMGPANSNPVTGLREE